MNRIKTVVPGLLAGVVGGVVGILVFEWLLRQRLYGLIIPGALAGLACGLASGAPSNLRGGLNALVALAAMLLAEWRNFPFKADEGLGYFLAHLHELRPATLLMTAFGAFIGFWWGRDRIRPGGRTQSTPTTAE